MPHIARISLIRCALPQRHQSYDGNHCSTIPRAIIVVKLTVIVLFVLVNVAFLAVLGPENIRESSAVAMVTIIYLSHVHTNAPCLNHHTIQFGMTPTRFVRRHVTEMFPTLLVRCDVPIKGSIMHSSYVHVLLVWTSCWSNCRIAGDMRRFITVMKEKVSLPINVIMIKMTLLTILNSLYIKASIYLFYDYIRVWHKMKIFNMRHFSISVGRIRTERKPLPNQMLSPFSRRLRSTNLGVLLWWFLWRSQLPPLVV